MKILLCVLPLLCAPASVNAAETVVAVAIGAVQGKAEVLLDGAGDWIPAKVGADLTPGTQVRTFLNSSVALGFSDGTKLLIGPDARFTLDENSPRRFSLFMGLGRLTAWVAKWRQGTFQARCPSAVAAVRGTVFALDVISGEEASIELFSGRLDLADKFGRVTSLGAGHEVRATAAGGASRPRALPPGTAMPQPPAMVMPPHIGAAAPSQARPAGAVPLAPLPPPMVPPPSPQQGATIGCGASPSAPCP